MAIRRPLCCFSFWTSGVGRVRTCPDESGRVGGRKKGTRSSLAAVPSSTNGRPRSFLFRPQGFVEGRRRCFFFGQTCRATILLRIKPGITGFYWFLLGYTGFYWVLTRFHWVLLGFTEFYWVLLGFTELQKGEITSAFTAAEIDRFFFFFFLFFCFLFFFLMGRGFPWARPS